MKAFVFGPGYVGEAYAKALIAEGWTVAASARDENQSLRLRAMAIEPVDPRSPDALQAAMQHVQAILVTAPPGANGCPGLAALAPAIAGSGAFPDWIGYLSSVAVYGDREGRWVDERSPLAATSAVGARRVAAERDWRQTGRGMGLTIASFRLPGIYGPRRSALDRLRVGDAHRVLAPGHVFSRIHRDDLVGALLASMRRPRPAAVYNICDDEPAPQHLVVGHAAQLLGVEPPPLTDEIPERSRRFYAESRRVSNALAKAELGWRPSFPSYREGLAAILAEEDTLPR